MIMRFDLESRTPTVTNVDDAGIFTRGHDDLLASGWQPAQMHARRLVGAVLRPHHRKNAKLNQSWLPVHERFNTFKLFYGEIVSGDDVRSYLFHKKGGRSRRQEQEIAVSA